MRWKKAAALCRTEETYEYSDFMAYLTWRGDSSPLLETTACDQSRLLDLRPSAATGAPASYWTVGDVAQPPMTTQEVIVAEDGDYVRSNRCRSMPSAPPGEPPWSRWPRPSLIQVFVLKL